MHKKYLNVDVFTSLEKAIMMTILRHNNTSIIEAVFTNIVNKQKPS